MKPRAVQHALVRMLFDPAYAAAVRGAGPVDGLGEPTSGPSCAASVDPRALTTDRHRRARAVHAIVDEYPASAAALGLAAARDLLRRRRRSHACIARRGAMALAFGTWLEDQAGGPGRIEAAGAALRRRPAPPPPGPLLRCAPHLAPLIVPAGSLAWYEATRGGSARSRCSPSPTPPRAPAPRVARPTSTSCSSTTPTTPCPSGSASEPLVRLLRFAERPRSERALAAEAVARGAASAETADLLASLLADGLLVRSA
jgi:hypothetical protein